MTELSACCSLAPRSAQKGGDGSVTTIREEPAADKSETEQSDEEDSEDDDDTDDGGSPSQSEAGGGGGEDADKGRSKGRRRSSLSVSGISQLWGKSTMGGFEKRRKMQHYRLFVNDSGVKKKQKNILKIHTFIRKSSCGFEKGEKYTTSFGRESSIVWL